MSRHRAGGSDTCIRVALRASLYAAGFLTVAWRGISG